MAAPFWPESQLHETRDAGIRWYRMGYQQRIHVVTSEGDMRRQAVDAWAATIRDVILAQETDAPMFIIVDLTAPGQGFTPYSRVKTQELLEFTVENREALTYIAVVLQNNIIMQILANFLQLLLNRTAYPRQIFTDPKAALDWMYESLENHYTEDDSAP